MAYSKATKLALKAKKVYSSIDSVWHCYYHALSGEELKDQIMTIAYKPTDQMNSWYFKDLNAPYKMYEDQGLLDFIKEKYNVSDNTIRKWLKKYETQQNINNNHPITINDNSTK